MQELVEKGLVIDNPREVLSVPWADLPETTKSFVDTWAIYLLLKLLLGHFTMSMRQMKFRFKKLFCVNSGAEAGGGDGLYISPQYFRFLQILGRKFRLKA